MYICRAFSLVIHHDDSPYSAFDNNPVYWSDPSGADSKPSINLSFQGDEAVQWIFNILVSIGTYTDKHDEKAALYGFDSFEEFINFFRADKNPESNNDGSADGGGDGGVSGNRNNSKGAFQPPTAIMKLAREIGMQYGYSIVEQDAIIAWLKTHTVIEKNGIVTLKGIDGLSININKSGLLIEKLIEKGVTSGSKFAFKKLIGYGTSKLIGGAVNMAINTQSLNNQVTYQQKAYEQAQKLALINSAGDQLIQYIFQRTVNVQEPSMLNDMTRIVTPTGLSLWQTKYY